MAKKKAKKVLRRPAKKLRRAKPLRRTAAPKKPQAPKPNAAQRKAFRRKTSFGVVFERRKAITQVHNKAGEWVKARSPGKMEVTSERRFGSEKEAKIHGRRFTRIEGHRGFEVVVLKLKPNAWINWKTGKTNPLIGRKRTNRR